MLHQTQQQPQQQQQQSNSFLATAKYYQFSTILEHVIDCFHTIVNDETNPYHPTFAWLTRKQPKPPDEELFLDLHDECLKTQIVSSASECIQLSSSVRSRLEKCPQQLRQEIASRTRDGCSPLFMACKNGLTRIVKYLLDVCSADIEQRGRFEVLEDNHVHSVTPLWVAAVAGHLHTVKLLIDRGADVNSISDTGSTPLRSVCFLCRDDDGMQEYDNINENSYSFGGKDSEEEDVYMKIAFLLVDNGADLSRSNYNGGTCLINSLHNYRLTKYILEHCVDIDAADNQSKTALHYAIQRNRVQVAKLLLARGADPTLRANNLDDALRLCSICGHEEIFEYLVENCRYSLSQLADAYKLIGSSLLEIHYDLARVRKYWTRALEIQSQIGQPRNWTNYSDIWRKRAFGDIREFNTVSELQSLTVDDFRIQSLLISERILGSCHRETIQRLLYRGNFYINSMRPSRCIDLWIYALKLKLDHDSIFHFESIFAAQAITKLFLDLLGQRQHQQVRFDSVHEVLTLLVGRIEECEHHLSLLPRSCLHEDIYDLLLGIIVNLLLISHSVQCESAEFQKSKMIITKLVRLSPRTSRGSTILHICLTSNIFEALRISKTASTPSSPVIPLIISLLDAGFDIDSTNNEGLSAFQSLCLTASIRVADKANVINLLVGRGAHFDRKTSTPGQREEIRRVTLECGLKPMQFLKLKCLAARKVSEIGFRTDQVTLPSNLRKTISIH